MDKPKPIAEAMISELDPVEVHGATDPIRIFRLSLHGFDFDVCTLGASIISAILPPLPSSGNTRDNAVVGYSSVAEMWASRNPTYFSVVPGRVANRIKDGRFQIEENSPVYQLDINNEPNHLHGGFDGFSHRIWDAQLVNEKSVRFTLISEDGDQGYPGKVRVTAEYALELTPSSCAVRLCLKLRADLLSSTPSPINLTQHTYWNLAGQHHSEGILGHDLRIYSDSYTPVDTTSIPTRNVLSLDDDPVMDWRTRRSLRTGLHQLGVEAAGITPEKVTSDLRDRTRAEDPYGFDHNYIVSSKLVAILRYQSRRLTVESNAPGVQLYTGNYLDGSGPGHHRWQGLCLETQHFPDSILVDEFKHAGFAKGKCPVLSSESPVYEQDISYTFESSSNLSIPSSTQGFMGTDSEGNVYYSVDSMWLSQGVTDEEDSSWYQRAADYYKENCPPTLDGVLGGFASISDVDLQGSLQFVRELAVLRPDLNEWFSSSGLRACECGAGLGRVTKGLLLSPDLGGFSSCDIVESSQELIQAAPEYMTDSIASRCRFFCVGLQDFQPSSELYSVIWVQWALCYLTDTDIVSFFKQCSSALREGGLIVLKENVCADSDFEVDTQDASVARSERYWRYLIGQSGLRIVHKSVQDGLPDQIYPVPMLALEPDH